MEFFKRNKTAVAIAAGLASVIGLGTYLVLRNPEEEEQVQKSSSGNQQQSNVQVQISQVNTPSVDPEQYRKKLMEIIATLQVVKDPQNPKCIEFQTIARILEASVELSSEQFVALTISQRQQRRGLSGEEYENLIISQSDEIEQLLNKVQEEIIAGLGISPQEFEESLMLIIQRGLHQQLMYLDMAVKQQLKMKITSDKELDLARAKEIIRYQNDIIEQQPEFFERILLKLIQNPEMQQKLPQIINTMLCDKVFAQYQIEEEDIVKMLGSHAQTDPEIHQLMQRAEEGMRGLLQKIAPPQFGGMM